MFKELKDMIKQAMEMATNPPKFDTTAFNDELAAQIEWSPAKGGGASFCTHKLKKISSSTVQFVPTVSALIFYGIFLVIGLLVMTLVTFSMYKQEGLSVELLFPIFFGAIFASVGGGLMYFGARPIVFDKKRNSYTKGKSSDPSRSYRKKSNKNIALSEIHAIQILSEYCRSDKSSYTSYELNLVLNDGTRINVVDHGKQSQILNDADTLSAFLGVPVWNKKDAFIYNNQNT